MKRLLFLVLAFSLASIPVLRADNDKDHKRHHRSDESAAPVRRQPAQQVQRRSTTNSQRYHAPNRQTIARQSQRIAPAQRNVTRNDHRNIENRNTRARTEAQLNNNRRVQPNRRVVPNQNYNYPRENSRVVRRQPNRRNFNPNSYQLAQNRIIRTPHNRYWWHRRYPNTTFILFGGGYYYWNAGYWYPAYGYSPIYNSYIYDQPIYGYNSLAPGQVIQNVQLALRNQGYNPGPIDGLMGSRTRDALAAYQRDHGLVVTAAVDEPTLVTLGLA